MKNLFASLSLLLFAMLVPVSHALAIDGNIEQIDPSSARQGQTVMLTISGENLPQGSVVLDFFPQRIQLLKILSASSDEIVAQVRIPSTAPAGSYNILVYNHLGEEAFGENLFTVDSDLVVPVISDYDPKVIAEADNGFALILTCDAITEPAVSHLSIEWSKGSLQLRRLETIFTYAGPDKIVAAISGALPEGSIRGRLKFDNTPIYLVELTIRASGAYVLGFSPTEIDPGSDREIKLIGSGFTSSFLDGLSIQLLYDDTPILPREKRVLDANRISLVFGDELAAGTYTLIVRQGEETLLLEDLLVKAGGILNQDTENNVVNQDDPPLADSSGQVQPEWSSGKSTGIEGTGTQGNGELITLEIGKMELIPGADPARFHLHFGEA